MILVDPRWAAVALAAWLLTYALHSTLLLGAVGLLSRFKRLPANLEQTLWKTALLGSLITATVVALGLTQGSLGARIHLAPTSPSNAVSRETPSLLPGRAGADAELPAQRTWIVLAVWAATGGLGLFRLSRARRHLRDALGKRRVLVLGPEWSVLEELRQAASLSRKVRFTVSPQLGSPIAIGDDEICFPERALAELKPEEIRSALAHELAHLVRRDPAWKSFAAGVSAIFFFQPLLKLARRRLDETAEYLADDWAVRHSGSEVSLARCLATVAGWQTRQLQSVAASGMAGGGSPLLKRVERLLGARPSELGRVWCYAGAALLVLGGWILAPGVTTSPRHVDPAPAHASLLFHVPDQPLLPRSDVTPLPEVFVLHPPPVRNVQPRARTPHIAPRHRQHAPEMAQRVPGTTPRAPQNLAGSPEMAQETLHIRGHAPLPDRDTAPVARVFIIPHETQQARLEILRALPEVQNLTPEQVRALIAMQQRLFEMEMAARGIRVVWMTEPPAPTPPPSPTSPSSI